MSKDFKREMEDYQKEGIVICDWAKQDDFFEAIIKNINYSNKTSFVLWGSNECLDNFKNKFSDIFHEACKWSSNSIKSISDTKIEIECYSDILIDNNRIIKEIFLVNENNTNMVRGLRFDVLYCDGLNAYATAHLYRGFTNYKTVFIRTKPLLYISDKDTICNNKNIDEEINRLFNEYSNISPSDRIKSGVISLLDQIAALKKLKI